MTATMNIEVAGLKEALKTIQKIDKVASNEIRRDARQIMKPIVEDAKARIPNTALSNMSRPWVSKKTGVQLLPWEGATARKYVKAKTSTKPAAEYGGYMRDLAVFFVSWAGGVNAIFDMAGRHRSTIMGQNLTNKFGPPSRVMWPAAEKNAAQVEAEIRKVIDRLMTMYNEEMYG
jgi:hypothetical protein